MRCVLEVMVVQVEPSSKSKITLAYRRYTFRRRSVFRLA
jgi:hypothetical protein